MAIKKQNRTIWTLSGIVFLLLAGLLLQDSRFSGLFRSDELPEAAPGESVEQFGEKPAASPATGGFQSQKKFMETMDRMVQCFQIQGSEIAESAAVSIESLAQKLEKDFGPVSMQSDRWMIWNLRARDGQERRLRLEIIESDEGKISKELHYFEVGREGQVNALEIDPKLATNPTDEAINQLLKDGEVTGKERAAAIFFVNNERVEYVERDGELAEVSVIRGEKQFKCQNASLPESCQCL